MIRPDNKRTFNWAIFPLAGIPVFILLYVMAAAFYPGGYPGHTHSPGFSWLHNYWCHLLNEQALNGEWNRGRPFAISGMMVLCISLACFWFYFPVISTISRPLQWLVRICGPLAMLNALFIGVFDHDLVTNIASGLGLIAVSGTLLILYRSGQASLFRLGLLNLVLVGLNNLLYYSPTLIHLLPVVQKISFFTILLWIWLMAFRSGRISRN